MPGSDCCATSGWPTEPANYPAACCPTRPTAGSCSATASGSRKNWRASSRASQRSMRCTSTRSAPNRRHATSQPLSEPRAARPCTATEHRALTEARHGGTAAACECPGDPAPGLAPFVRSRSDCSARPAVADVRGQRRMQDLDWLKSERPDAVEDPLAGAKQDRRDVERELVDDAGNEGLAHSRGATRDVYAALAGRLTRLCVSSVEAVGDELE